MQLYTLRKKLLDEIDIDTIISDFAWKNARRRCFSLACHSLVLCVFFRRKAKGIRQTTAPLIFADLEL